MRLAMRNGSIAVAKAIMEKSGRRKNRNDRLIQSPSKRGCKRPPSNAGTALIDSLTMTSTPNALRDR